MYILFKYGNSKLKQEMLYKLPLIFCSLSLAWLFMTVVIGGAVYPDYNHASQFMSELGATDSPVAFYINYFGFIPTEIFILFFIYFSYRALPRSTALQFGMLGVFIYALSLLLAAYFNCDTRCRPESPTMFHAIHMILGAIAYITAALAIFVLSLDAKRWSNSSVVTFTGVIITSLVLLLIIQLDGSYANVGIVQRVLELLIYSWFIIFSVAIIKMEAPIHDKV